MQEQAEGDVTTYSERLYVPLRWWVQATMFLATVWLAFIVALPAWMAWTASGLMTAATYAWFAWIGAARIAVSPAELYAGTAHIPRDLLGEPRPLDAEQTRRVLGVEADARAFLITRPYLKRAVQVPVHDTADPAPYWLVGTRHPDRLSAALGATASA